MLHPQLLNYNSRRAARFLWGRSTVGAVNGMAVGAQVAALEDKLAGMTATPQVGFTPKGTQLNAIGAALHSLDAQAVAAGG